MLHMCARNQPPSTVSKRIIYGSRSVIHISQPADIYLRSYSSNCAWIIGMLCPYMGFYRDMGSITYGSELWKHLPLDIVSCDSIFQLKKCLKKRYNTYVDDML